MNVDDVDIFLKKIKNNPNFTHQVLKQYRSAGDYFAENLTCDLDFFDIIK